MFIYHLGISQGYLQNEFIGLRIHLHGSITKIWLTLKSESISNWKLTTEQWSNLTTKLQTAAHINRITSNETMESKINRINLNIGSVAVKNAYLHTFLAKARLIDQDFSIGWMPVPGSVEIVNEGITSWKRNLLNCMNTVNHYCRDRLMLTLSHCYSYIKHLQPGQGYSITHLISWLCISAESHNL